MVRNQVADTGGLANRAIIFHTIRPEILRVYLFEVTSWFLPEALTLPRLLRAAAAVLLAGSAPIMFIWEKIRKKAIRSEAQAIEYGSVPWQLLFYIPAYLAVLALNSFLLDAGTTYSGAIRYLMPLHVMVIILEVMTVHYLLPRKSGTSRLSWIVALYAAGLIITSLLPTLQLASKSTLELGFTGIRNEMEDVAELLQDRSEAIPLISNNPEMVYYLVDRPAYMKPIKFDVYQQAERDDFDVQIELAKSRLASGSLFVFFDEPSEEETEILQLLNATPIFQSPKVTVFAYPEAQ
jgi:hypothetical protein